MRLRLLPAVLFITIAGPTRAEAQASESDFSAWLALLSTPAGAFPAMTVDLGSGADRHTQYALRVSSWKLEGSKDRDNNFGGSFVAPLGAVAQLTGTIGYYKPGFSGAPGVFLLGADVERQVFTLIKGSATATSLTVGVRGSAGYGTSTGDQGGTAVSLVGAIPVALRYPFQNKSSVSLTASPALGFGNRSGFPTGASMGSGTRPMLAFGGAWRSAAGLGVHLGMQKIYIDGVPAGWISSAGVSFGGH